MSKPLELTSVIRQARGPQHTATVLFLHGLGDSGKGWIQTADQIGQTMPHVKFILPNAPVRPVTIFNGYRTPAWFDILQSGHLERMLSPDDAETWILNTANSVNRLILDEVDSGIPAQRIVVGGFSQGCAQALVTSLISEYKFAGIIGLGGYLPSKDKILSIATDANKNTPIFVAHGDADETVPFNVGEMTSEILKDKGYNVTFKSYAHLGHWINEDVTQDMLSFLQQTFVRKLWNLYDI
ncbi:7932_t:CDS:2 [Paraglomus brasilianum]|uniref:Acyl-protein thioesterase 1 n=1 Tax=Paraglomus brasilianum TaxID=144538 RepID=A0A9N9DCG1_9GLOM|nr:7932_t:CDS:2 [Paraglomus brasilianum]